MEHCLFSVSKIRCCHWCHRSVNTAGDCNDCDFQKNSSRCGWLEYSLSALAALRRLFEYRHISFESIMARNRTAFLRFCFLHYFFKNRSSNFTVFYVVSIKFVILSNQLLKIQKMWFFSKNRLTNPERRAIIIYVVRHKNNKNEIPCGCSSMVEFQPSKLVTWVRFPSPAPIFQNAPLTQLDRVTAF